MQKKIGRKVYDSEKAEYIGDQTVGYFGEDYGFRETLYRKAKDDFFIVGLGGANSPYPEESLAVLDMEAVEEWLCRVLGKERAEEVLAKNRSEAEEEKARSEEKSAAKKGKAKKPAAKKAAPAAAKTVKVAKGGKRAASSAESAENTKREKAPKSKKSEK